MAGIGRPNASDLHSYVLTFGTPSRKFTSVIPEVQITLYFLLGAICGYCSTILNCMACAQYRNGKWLIVLLFVLGAKKSAGLIDSGHFTVSFFLDITNDISRILA